MKIANPLDLKMIGKAIDRPAFIKITSIKKNRLVTGIIAISSQKLYKNKRKSTVYRK